MKRLFFSAAIILMASSALAATSFTLNPLGSFGRADGSIQPADQAWVDTGFNQRGLSYDPVSGNLVYVDTHSGQAGSTSVTGSVYVLNGSTGNVITTLNTNGISGGNYADIAVAVADDGVVYLCNQVAASSSLAFKIYRWDSVTSVDPPVVAFSGTLTPSQRYAESIDIRGAGPNTQIIIGAMAGTTATNVVLFTTANGTNFSANVIGCTNLFINGTVTNNVGQNFNEGIAFGVGDTFWAKSVGRPLLYMSFDATAKTARIVNSYASSNMVGVANLGPIAVSTNLNLLAAIEEGNGTVTGGPERIFLYDISDTSKAPVLLSIRSFSPNNLNATAPLGYLDFGPAALYANNINNGLLASTVDATATPAPSIISDLPGTNRAFTGQTAHWEVMALPNITNYQWSVDGTSIPGATSYFFDLPNVSLSDSGKVYSVTVNNDGGSATSANSLLSVVNPADLFHLTPLWGFGPGQTNYISNSGNMNVPNERTFAYNSLSNQLIVVKRVGTAVTNFVIDPHTGEVLYTLKTNGIVLGGSGSGVNVPVCGIAVAGDGAVYACDVCDVTAANSFKVYRWADSGPNTYPSNVFNAASPAVGVATANFRWGDVLDVRGSDTGTQIIVDNQDTTTTAQFRGLAVLTPTDATMSAFAGKGFVLQNIAGGNTIGRSLQFGTGGDYFWQKRYVAGGADLVQSSFNLSDPDPAVALVVSTSSSGSPLFTNGAVNINFTFKLAAAVNFSGVAGSSPDELDLYDFASPSTPVLINRYNFPANQNGNANKIAQVMFATNSALGTNYVFALDANNGIVAFTLSTGALPPPKILAQPRNLRVMQGVTGSLSVVLDSISFVQWQRDSGGGVFTNIPVNTTSYAIANAQLSNAGSYRVYATNTSGAVTSTVATVSVNLPAKNYSLAQVWGAGPASQPYVTGSAGNGNTPLERSIAYNALSNQIIVVQCPVGSPSFTVYVVDAATGANLYTLNTNGIVHEGPSEIAGSNPIDLVSVAVSDDGSIYLCNESPNASGGINLPDPTKQFRIYRWADSGSSTVPMEIFAGDPAGQTNQNVRWGDAMTVRGAGLNTEILVDDTTLGTFAGILRPTDASLTTFTNLPLNTTLSGGSIGHSLQFSSGTNFWQKRKGLALNLVNYDTNAQSSVGVTNYPNFPFTLGGVAVDEARKLVIGVDFVGTANTPDAVDLYEISDPSTPMLIAKYNFPSNQIANANFVCQTLVAGNRVFSLDANNGIVAFTLVPTLKIESSNPNLVLSWQNLAGFTLQAAPTASATWTNVTTGTLVSGRYYATNSLSSNSLLYRLHATLGQ